CEQESSWASTLAWTLAPPPRFCLISTAPSCERLPTGQTVEMARVTFLRLWLISILTYSLANTRRRHNQATHRSIVTLRCCFLKPIEASGPVATVHTLVVS